jgi:hypothetical protein
MARATGFPASLAASHSGIASAKMAPHNAICAESNGLRRFCQRGCPEALVYKNLILLRTRRDGIQPKLLAVCLRLRYACTMGRFITVQAGSKYRSLRLNPEAVLKARARLMRRGGLLALMTIMEYLALSPEATGRLFGVSRQAVNLWLNTGVPADRRASVERVSSLTQLLTQTFKKERIPEIVREPMPGLADTSILSTISESGAAPVFAMLDRARSYVPEA